MRLKKLLGSISLVCLCLGSFALAFDCDGHGTSPHQVFYEGVESQVNDTAGAMFQLMPYGNFLFNSSDKVFHVGDNTNGGRLFWYDQKLYLIVSKRGNIDYQGFVQYYTTAGTGDICVGNSHPIDDFYSDPNYHNPDSLSYFKAFQYSYEFAVCFGYSDLGYSTCFNYNNLTGSLGLSFSDLNSMNILYEDSPFTSYFVPDSEIIYIYPGLTGTNLDYYNAFLERGYYKGLCYSDFYTGSLVDSGTLIPDLFIGDLDDSTYYGHSVFDFYSGSNTSLSTHSRSQQRYALMKYTYERNDLTPYIGFQKGTRNIMFNIYNNHFNDNFSWIDYRTFCDMTVNGFNDNEIFNGDVSQSMKDYTQRLEDEKQFVLSGADEDFSGADGLLGLFNGLYSRFKTAFPVDPNLSSKETGILPSYIILAFFLFLLLYVLKR